MFDSREFQYSDTKVSLLGLQLEGLRGLTYKKEHEKEAVTGQGSDPKAIQRKFKKYDGTLMMLKSDYDILDRAAVAAGYEDLIDVPGKFIAITCVYDKDDGSPIATDILINVEFTSAEDGMKTGDAFKEVSLPFLFLKKKKS